METDKNKFKLPVSLLLIGTIAVLLSIKFSFEGLASYGSTIIFFTGFSLLVYRLFHKAIDQFLFSDFIASNLVYSRILYAVFALISECHKLMFLESGLEPMSFNELGIETRGVLAYGSHAFYILGLVLILVGKKTRLGWVLAFLFGGLVVPFALELFFRSTITFFALFVPSTLWNGTEVENSSKYSWPINLMFLSFAVLTFWAGVYKALDPIWIAGDGMYFSLNIPLFMPEHLWPLLDSRALMSFGNYAAVISECLAIPLILFKRTRALALLSIVFLAFFIAYPMAGIGIEGGPVLISMAPAFAAVCNIKLPKLPSFLAKGLSGKSTGISIGNSTKLAYLVAGYTFFGIVSHSLLQYRSVMFFPNRHGELNYQIADSNHLLKDYPKVEYGLYLSSYQLWKTYKLVPKYYRSVWVFGLFDYQHLFDRQIFRVKINYENGSQTFDYFHPQGSMNAALANTYCERVLLIGWKIAGLGWSDEFTTNKIVPEYEKREFDGILRHSANLQQDLGRPISGELECKLVEQPTKYQGNTKLVKDKEWRPFYVLDFATEDYKIVGLPERFDCETLEYKVFKERQIFRD